VAANPETVAVLAALDWLAVVQKATPEVGMLVAPEAG